MNLPALRFNGEILPHNPHTLKITYARDIKKVSIPNYGEIYGDYGRNARVVTGDGELSGENASEMFSKLVQIHDSGTEGVLSLPELAPFRTVLSELSLTREPKDSVIGYRFKFIEKIDIPSEAAAQPKKSIITEADCDLWHIAANYGVDIETLIAKNPSVENPFSTISAGCEVYL